MRKSIDKPLRGIPLVVGVVALSLLPEAAVAAPPSRPGLPEVLTFQLEDGRHRTRGLTLSFALPGSVDYECRRIVYREERQDREIRIILLEVAQAAEYRDCRTAKVPAPIRERIVLPPEPGHYRLVFVGGGRRDTYALDVTEDVVTFDVEGISTFTACEETGKLMRVGARWLWVDFSFLTAESFRKMSPKRDEVLRDLAAIGAKAFTPAPGRYLLDGFVREFPRSHGPDAEVRDERFFLWDGDWEGLRKLANRYRKYSTVAFKRPVMMLWLNSRDNVVSTRGGTVNADIAEEAAPIVQPTPARQTKHENRGD